MEQIKISKGDSKWDVRQNVWSYIEKNNLANFPRPVQNRIPNFKGAKEASGKVAQLEAFIRAAVVKVDPDKPMQGVRLAALQAGKTLLVPTPRLRSGLLNRIVPPGGATPRQLHLCSSSQGVQEFSIPVGIEDSIRVDLVVVGSVAVSEKGYRIGKGEGFADMEHAVMASMNAVSESTMVLTVVHDCQVMEIPEDLIEPHDLTVDLIITPTRIIQSERQHSKPQGIIWSKLCAEDLRRIPILKSLRVLERDAGKDVSLKSRAAGEEMVELKPDPGEASEFLDSPIMVHLNEIPPELRVSELKRHLRDQEVAPLKVIWDGTQHRACLTYSDYRRAEQAISVLQKLSIDGQHILVECYERPCA